jgi:RNA polymerase sigma factor (sigma-70 family)
MSTSPINAKIESLTRRIHNAAVKVAASQPVPGLVDPDDIAQEMALRMLERAAQITDLAEQSDAYLMIDAIKNAGWHTCQKEVTYLKYVEPEPMVSSDDDEDAESLLEFIPSQERDPEQIVIERQMVGDILLAMRNLSEPSRKLIVLSATGLSEIARKLGVSKAAISQRRNTIRKNLADLADSIAE